MYVLTTGGTGFSFQACFRFSLCFFFFASLFSRCIFGFLAEEDTYGPLMKAGVLNISCSVDNLCNAAQLVTILGLVDREHIFARWTINCTTCLCGDMCISTFFLFSIRRFGFLTSFNALPHRSSTRPRQLRSARPFAMLKFRWFLIWAPILVAMAMLVMMPAGCHVPAGNGDMLGCMMAVDMVVVVVKLGGPAWRNPALRLAFSVLGPSGDACKKHDIGLYPAISGWPSTVDGHVSYSMSVPAYTPTCMIMMPASKLLSGVRNSCIFKTEKWVRVWGRLF